MAIINFEEIQSLLQELQESPYIDSNVTHKMTNNESQAVMVRYLKYEGYYELADGRGEKIKHYSDSEELAGFLNEFMKDTPMKP